MLVSLLIVFFRFFRRLDCRRWRYRKPNARFPSTGNRFFLQKSFGGSKTCGNPKEMRCFDEATT